MANDLNINSDDQYRPVFCNEHRERGQLTFKIRGMEGLKTKQKNNKNQGQSKVVHQPAGIQMSSPNAVKQIIDAQTKGYFEVVNDNKKKRKVVINKGKAKTRSQKKLIQKAKKNAVVTSVRRESKLSRVSVIGNVGKKNAIQKKKDSIRRKA